MAEPIPFAVTSNLIHRLASAEFLEFGQEYDVKKELEVLKKTIESINDVLLDADHKQDQVRVRNWISDFKEVLYAADDFIDDLAIESRRDKLGATDVKEVNRVLRSISSSNQLPLYNEMPNKIKEIRERKQILVLKSDIIGRDDSKKEIISLLTQPHENQKVSVIAIVGLGGLGKTTLAQLVYNELEEQNSFEMQMWVCVSDNFDVKTILKKILESIPDGQRQDQSLEKLQKELRRSLSGKKYLLVLDDIWNECHTKWAEVRKYLMCGAQDSKILVTTRSENVAKAMTASTSYPLKGLTDEESWSLLKNIAFEDDSRVNRNLESMGKEIAKKCKGVPLAVKTLGGLLRGQNQESRWENVLHGDFWKLCEEQDSVMPILKVSYHNLSSDMRQYFAYCSLYPKDSEIPKDELIKSWMAQGYLNCSTEKQQMEDVGNQFVKMFLMNSFFQETTRDEHGEIFSFKMHDLMHDLAMLVAGNDYCYLDSKTEKVEGRPMHVSLESDETINVLKSLDPNRLRTLILPNDFEEEKYLSIIAKFKYLRVLRMSSLSFHKLFDSIGKLKHLRYLDILDDFSLSGMPVGLGKLYSLQSLSTFVVGDSQETKYGTLHELKDLNLKGKLKIQHLDRVRDVAVESHDVNLKEKKFLHSLTLDWSIGSIIGNSLPLLENLEPHRSLKRLEVKEYPGMRFPNWLSLLTNVVDIRLYFLSNCRCLPPLERLPSLKSLDIEFLDELEYIYLYEDGFAVTFFPSLQSLLLESCPKLRGWRRQGDDINDSHNLSSPLSFPHLSHLLLSKCPQLTCMPTFLALEDLGWCDSSVEPLIGTLNTRASTCSAGSSSSAAPLSMLKEWRISNDVNIKALPKGWMQNLTSLESLLIDQCESETLEEFGIGFKDDTNCLPSLRKISISGCNDLEALPDWICNLASLHHIDISGCPHLASLPEGISGLTNLKMFEVGECSLLIEECRRETSAVSRQIAHIPQIILREE
ncbi:putative disease resistance protein RGA1 [Abrus precatorius]|uniref:Disease resistance protein RGA1 n=1 Tax=Abrus precatorius TaxID=3816 RepID=A0A8B8JZS9_ABRPR|nr:putative disease resistance protein RGA1 [Abrus precatorius]